MMQVRMKALWTQDKLTRIHSSLSSVVINLFMSAWYLKGLLSIPCDGRGARRPLGQSFRESVGPANVKLSGGTPHSTASQSRNGFEEKRVCGENEWTTAWSYKNRKTMAASSFKGHTIADALS